MSKVKIKMLTSMASPDWSVAAGEEIEVKEEVAKAWIEANIATLAKNSFSTRSVIETATQPKPENASIKYPKHVGGGWYELSNGEKVQGKKEAIKAQKELEGR